MNTLSSNLVPLPANLDSYTFASSSARTVAEEIAHEIACEIIQPETNDLINQWETEISNWSDSVLKFYADLFIASHPCSHLSLEEILAQ